MAKAKRAARSRATPAAKTPARMANEKAKTIAAENAITPLEVMLGAMRELWQRAAVLKGRPDCEEERLTLIRQASAEAHKAAVYVHPRLASVGSDEEGEGQAQATAPDGVPGDAPPLGSRELARRLLFAVAVAEHFSTDSKSQEKP